MTRLGITGHQWRPEIDWNWVEEEIDGAFVELANVDLAYSSLAVGADQIFADVALRRGVKVVAVIPLVDYERFFEGSGRETYDRLLLSAEKIELRGDSDPQKAFFEAGRYIVDHVDRLIAVWDGKPAQGVGGTADIVSYAETSRRPTLHLDTAHHSKKWIF
jgi:hypothetical protein